MNEKDFYNDVLTKKKSDKLFFDKKTIIISLIVLFVIVFAYLFFFVFDFGKGTYSLKFENPIVLYMDEPLDIPIELKGSGKYMDDVSIGYASEDEDVVEIVCGDVGDEDGFFGSKGSMVFNPVSVGEDNISIIATYGVDKFLKTLDTKTIHVVVCPKFDNNLLSSQTISMQKGRNTKLKLNFNNDICSNYITYSSQDESIAVVKEDGSIFGISSGTTTVNISNGVNSFDLVVNVID